MNALISSGRRKFSPLLGLIAAALSLGLPLIAWAQDKHFVATSGASGGSTWQQWLFWIMASLTIMGAVATITRRNPVVAAICLIWTLGATAGLYLMLHATFMAAIQVLVYAGAIMVLFVFVVMAVDRPEEEELGLSRGSVMKLLGILALLGILLRVGALLTKPEIKRFFPAVSSEYGQVESMGRLLFGDYLFPFEVLSLLLLVAIVGAVVVTRRRKSNNSEVIG